MDSVRVTVDGWADRTAQAFFRSFAWANCAVYRLIRRSFPDG